MTAQNYSGIVPVAMTIIKEKNDIYHTLKAFKKAVLRRKMAIINQPDNKPGVEFYKYVIV